jgi:hypothetical protein
VVVAVKGVGSFYYQVFVANSPFFYVAAFNQASALLWGRRKTLARTSVRCCLKPGLAACSQNTTYYTQHNLGLQNVILFEAAQLDFFYIFMPALLLI